MSFWTARLVLLAEGAPLAGREEVVVAGVAEFLYLMEPGFSLGEIVGDSAVYDQEPATGLQNPGALPDEISW